MEGVHHTKTKEAYIGRKEWWEQEIDILRCDTCWLRRYQCYCGSLLGKRLQYDSLLSQESQKFKIEVYMYYHHLEIGRSSNTAHIFEALCDCIVTPLIYGDESSEAKLMETISAEYKSGEAHTCILYPKNDSSLLSDWISSTVLAGSSSSAANENSPNYYRCPTIRLIVLDGTYPCASRMARALVNMRTAYGIPDAACPFVKLDLSEAGCKSAVAGIMYQPGKFKICSYQAIVLAIQQVYESFEYNSSQLLVTTLLQDLDLWIAYIVKTKITFAKSKPVTGIDDDVDNTPAEFIQEIVVSPLIIYPIDVISCYFAQYDRNL